MVEYVYRIIKDIEKKLENILDLIVENLDRFGKSKNDKRISYTSEITETFMQIIKYSQITKLINVKISLTK